MSASTALSSGSAREAVILGALCTLGMAVLGIPYAAMTGAVIALTALIPVAGAYIGAAIGVLMIITVSPIKAILFVVFIVVLQQIEGNFIYPKVVGSSLGLPAIWVLTAVIVGGGADGVGGMLVGVPIAATLYRLLRDDVYGSGSVRTGTRHQPRELPYDLCVMSVRGSLQGISRAQEVRRSFYEIEAKCIEDGRGYPMRYYRRRPVLLRILSRGYEIRSTTEIERSA